MAQIIHRFHEEPRLFPCKDNIGIAKIHRQCNSPEPFVHFNQSFLGEVNLTLIK